MKKLTALLVVCMLSCFVAVSFAQEAEQKEKKKQPAVKSDVKEIQGELVWVGKNFISLVYERDGKTGQEKEIRLDLDPKDVVLQHIQSLGQLHVGDAIKVQYLDETKDFGNTSENKIQAKVVTFLNPAGVDSPYKIKKDVEAPIEESLSLKGVKSDE